MFGNYSRSVAVIHTPSLCEDPSFNPAIVDNLNTVVCRLIVPDNEEDRMVYLETIHAKQKNQHLDLNEDAFLNEEEQESEIIRKQELDTQTDKARQSSEISSLMETLDIPDDVKDALNSLLNENAEVFAEEEKPASQKSNSAKHATWGDVPILVHDEL